MITRDIYTFSVQAFGKGETITLDNGMTATVNQPITPEVMVMETSLTETEARKALKAEGHTVPKGSTLEIKKVARVKYACTLRDFLSVATVVEELNVED